MTAHSLHFESFLYKFIFSFMILLKYIPNSWSNFVEFLMATPSPPFFYRKFGTRCSGCNHGILPLETVRRVRNLVFHLHCFVCLVCQRELVTGDHFYLVDGRRLVCQEDYVTTRGKKFLHFLCIVINNNKKNSRISRHL